MKNSRVWRLMVWTGNSYKEANCGDSKIEANSPKDAIRKAGLEDPMYQIKYSRKGYGYFTGRIEVRLKETVAANENLPLPADFVLLAIS